jgi:hypothetical protein
MSCIIFWIMNNKIDSLMKNYKFLKMIFILFGIWLITCLFLIYFCRGMKIECDLNSDVNDIEEEKEEDEKEGEEVEDQESGSSDSNDDSDDSDYVNSTEETEASEEIESDGDNIIGSQQILGKQILQVRPEYSKRPKFYVDPISKRVFSRKWIASLLPYTKGNHFWLVSRENLKLGYLGKDSIEIVKNNNAKIVTIRHWNRNRIDSVEVIFFNNNVEYCHVRKYDKGKEFTLPNNNKERNELLVAAQELFEFYCSSSPYVKNLNIQSSFH